MKDADAQLKILVNKKLEMFLELEGTVGVLQHRVFAAQTHLALFDDVTCKPEL